MWEVGYDNASLHEAGLDVTETEQLMNGPTEVSFLVVVLLFCFLFLFLPVEVISWLLFFLLFGLCLPAVSPLQTTCPMSASFACHLYYLRIFSKVIFKL